MLDLETMGKASGCAIISIGAVAFDLEEQKLGSEFYVNVDLQSCMDAGLTVDASTVMWWLSQSDGARSALADSPIHLVEALSRFDKFISLATFGAGSVRLWGNGAAFDNVILSAAYSATGRTPPWMFWNDMCYRTMKSSFIGSDAERSEGVQHHALDDAKWQAINLLSIHKKGYTI